MADVPLSLQTIATGEIRCSTQAEKMPDIDCVMVKFKARSGNSGSIYIGGSGVTVPEGNTDITSGFELAAGDDSGWLSVENLNKFYRICSTNGDGLTYLALR